MKSKEALEKLIENNFLITSKESEQNIRDNMVFITSIRKKEAKGKEYFSSEIEWYGTGLLLTTDGYMLTANHVIEQCKKNKKQIPIIINKNSVAHPIILDETYTDGKKDMALVKTDIRKKPEPVRFYFLKDELLIGDEIELLGMQLEGLCSEKGRVELKNCSCAVVREKELVHIIKDLTFIDQIIKEGMSGGAVINSQGMYAGMMCISEIYKLELTLKSKKSIMKEILKGGFDFKVEGSEGTYITTSKDVLNFLANTLEYI